MKKVLTLIILSLCIIFSASFVSNASEDLKAISKPGVPFYTKGQLMGNLDLMEIAGIDYIALDDFYRLIKPIIGFINGEIVYKDNLKTDNSAEYTITAVYGPIDIKLDVKIDFKKNVIYNNGMEVLNLNDVDMKLFKDNDKGYMPVSAVGFLSYHFIQLYDGDGQYYLMDQLDFGQELYTPNGTGCLNAIGKEGELTPDLKKKTFLYFMALARNYCWYVKQKGIDLDKIQKEYLEKAVASADNSAFYSMLNEAANDLRDLHTEIKYSGYEKTGYFRSYNAILAEKRNAHDENIPGGLPVLDGAFMFRELDKETGYMRVPTFAGETKDFCASIDELVESARDKKFVIVDIRGNGGGSTENFIYLLQNMVKDKFTVFNDNFEGITGSKKVINGKATEIKRTSENYLKGKLILLTDRYSFSSSNLVALVFKENKLGTIIGEKTGGGSHSVYAFVLPDNTVMRLGTCHVLTDKKGDDFEEGLEPDIDVLSRDIDGKDTVLEAAMKYIKKAKCVN